ncbi:hypothetical protein AKJ09_02215 [Labilithrix luteola]|uniref:STAS/SEC14 domain-containing protein n=1 Tax=Labilithrix luteola TaxID=1391654 RepID=A0A0K1PQ87_9BACT|nr:hypothetical protein [Labilithrix luteola]AKU95551.1 hypothetical protein AKJ09_02215 [Labilithrix luteola]
MRLHSRDQTCALSPGGPLTFTWSGIIDPSDVTALFRDVRRHLDGWDGRLLWDMTSTQLIPGDTRRLFLDELVKLPLAATAIVTSEFFVRVPVTMLFEVVATEAARSPSYRFFDSVADASAWLASLEQQAESAQ